MKVRINRDSVCAGDDIDAHDENLEVADVESLTALVTILLARYSLPSIAGERATWCLSSRRPIAVVAQQWREPRLVNAQTWRISDCAIVDGTVRFHFSYLAQIDPDVAFDVIRCLRFEA